MLHWRVGVALIHWTLWTDQWLVTSTGSWRTRRETEIAGVVMTEREKVVVVGTRTVSLLALHSLVYHLHCQQTDPSLVVVVILEVPWDKDGCVWEESTWKLEDLHVYWEEEEDGGHQDLSLEDILLARSTGVHY